MPIISSEPRRRCLVPSSAQHEIPAASSTLRARLQSQPDPESSSASPKRPAYPDVYQQFRACFATDARVEREQDASSKAADNDSGPVSKLRESFARQGTRLHASAMEQLIQAHDEIQSRVDNLALEASTTISQCRALYGNIAYPLSATLCHTDSFPRATIATHLASIKHDIRSSEEELRKLQHEWDACVQTESDAWKELTGTGKPPKRGSRSIQASTVMESFKAEAESIVNEKCRILTDVEKASVLTYLLEQGLTCAGI